MTVKTYKFTENGLSLIKPHITAISIKITKRFYTHGEFELKIPADVLSEFKEDIIVELDHEFFGIVKKRVTSETAEENTATVSGYCIKYIAAKRECVITKEENSDILGYDEVSGSTEYCMKHYVDRHIVNPSDTKRKIPFIEIGMNYNRGIENDAYYARYVSISEILHNIGSRAKIGFDFLLSSDKKKFIFDVIESRDRSVDQTQFQPVVLKTGEGLTSKTHEIDSKDAANTFYCTRTGYDFEDEAFTQILYTDNEKTGYAREEYALNITVDADAEDIYKNFEENAREEIEGRETKESIECEIDKNNNLKLGDIITLESDGVQINRQITEIAYEINENEEKIIYVFGDKYLTKFERNSREVKKAEHVAVDNARQIRAQDKQLELINFKLPEMIEKQTEATEMMAAAFGFYTWEYSEPADGWPAGQYVCAVSKSEATKDTEIWIRNAAGYAHYKNGINGNATSGMLRDDSILANAIVAGMISCAKLTTGILGSKSGKFWMDLDTWEYDFGGMLTCKRNEDGTYKLQIKMSDGREIESAITATNNKLSLVVTEKPDSGETVINSAEIVAGINASASEIMIEANKIYIASTKDNLSAYIKTTDEAIAAEVKRSTDQDAKLAASLKLNSENIAAEVMRATEAEQEMCGRIEINNNKIAVLVTEAEGENIINTAGIVAAINDSESNVQISADKIFLNGSTIISALQAGEIATGMLSVISKTGHVLINANAKQNELNIGGFTVYRDQNKGYIAINKTNYDDGEKGVYVGTNGIGLGRGVLYATESGFFHAENADITGTIKANSGKIGGWEINQSFFGKQGSRYGCFILSTLSEASDDVIFIRDKNGSESEWLWTYPFVLKADGSATLNKLTANGAKISGSIFSGTLQAGTVLVNGIELGYYTNPAVEGYGMSKMAASGYREMLLMTDEGMYLMKNRAGDTANGVGITDSGTYLYGYAGSTSDARAKKNVLDISDKYSTFFDELKPRTFEYKNGTSKRIWTGFVAQEVKKALEKSKLTTQEFAGIVIPPASAKDQNWSIRYELFIALCVNEIQKLKKYIKERGI